MANVNFVALVSKRIDDKKSSEATKSTMKTLRSFLKQEDFASFLHALGCKSSFDFDIHSVKHVHRVVNFAMGKGSANDIDLCFEAGIKTALKFQEAGKAFTAKDIEMALNKSIKVPADKKELICQRPDFYENKGNWQNRVITVMRELNCFIPVSRSEYRFADNALSQAFKAAYFPAPEADETPEVEQVPATAIAS